jgi:hypothetical protein
LAAVLHANDQMMFCKFIQCILYDLRVPGFAKLRRNLFFGARLGAPTIDKIEYNTSVSASPQVLRQLEDSFLVVA